MRRRRNEVRHRPSRRVPAFSGDATTQSLKRRVESPRGEEATRYVLRLYVTGLTPASRRAIRHVREICDEHLKGRYDLEVVDIYQMPALAKDEQIIAAPTLVKVLPEPLRRLIGDLSDTEKVLFGMDLRPRLR